MNPKVNFSDDDLMVLDKPPGLVTDPNNTSSEINLAEIMQREYGISLERGGVVHRLDKDTSGLIIIAKTQAALENLQAQFKDRSVKKEYLCLVHGQVAKEFTVEGAITRNPDNREKFIVSEPGSFAFDLAKPAKTTFKPEKQLTMSEETISLIFEEFNKIQIRKLSTIHYPLFTLLRAFPETGRTHQIRVHLKYQGFPIVSDEKYGGRKVVRLDKRWCPRQFLHAAKIEFNHPKTGERLIFESPLPEDLQKALGYLN